MLGPQDVDGGTVSAVSPINTLAAGGRMPTVSPLYERFTHPRVVTTSLWKGTTKLNGWQTALPQSSLWLFMAVRDEPPYESLFCQCQ
ncbi:hypothetical protein EVAR_9304_1 [Eumeta japonica]|uniref:Uncharacterized protein n=1 Tax=Eumeta variegata TaxID=151549 RepID=A0A4C1TMM8_EUMVA|nr:hypothetical protein EVAR_9304_1 [Eumeta japonica]